MNSLAELMPMDIHICGACRKQFSDVEMFVEHKKTGCPALLSLQHTAFQTPASQPAVNNDELGKHISESGVNRFTIPLPSVHIQDSSCSQQSHEAGQTHEAEIHYQIHVSDTENRQVDQYSHMTGAVVQTDKSLNYSEYTAATQVPQQPLGHEYVKSHSKNNKYYLQLSQAPSLEHDESAVLSTADNNDEMCAEDILADSQGNSQYQDAQQKYVLQQSEEVYNGLAHTESQSESPEPVYTLETHEEPSVFKQGELPQGNVAAPANDRTVETDVIHFSPAHSNVDVVSSSLSFAEMPVSVSQIHCQRSSKVFQQAVSTSMDQSYINADVNCVPGQVPFVLNEMTTSGTQAILQSTAVSSQKQPTSMKKSASGQETWTRTVNKQGEGPETTNNNNLQQELSPDKPSNVKHSQPKAPPEKKFVCNYEDCTYRSAYMKDLERHYRTHTGEKPYCCVQCGKSFNRNDKLILHMRYHSGEKSFKCQLCDYSCVESGSLKKHMRRHTEERPFKCQVCPYGSRSSGQLQIHLRTHTGDKPYTCVMCNATFKVTSDLKRHMRIHTGEKPYSCDQCDYRCSVKGNLKSHMRVNHSSKYEVTCQTCEFKSSSKKALREHMKLHEINDELTCNVCSYQCASKSALKNHMLRHNKSEDSLVKCSYCDYKTRQSGNVVAHIKRKHPSRLHHRKKIGRLHRKQNKGHEPYVEVSGNQMKARCKKTFKCTLCDNSFVREDSLKCHMKQHRDLSKSSLSTAYAVLKLQQPVLNVNMQRDDNQNVSEELDPSLPYVPPGARAGIQMQPQSEISSRSGQIDTVQGQCQTQNLSIKDILAAAAINNNGSKDIGPEKHSSPSQQVTTGPNISEGSSPAKCETIGTDLVSNYTITQSAQDVPTVQVMQNISLPYIQLPDGRTIVLGQNSVNQAPTPLQEVPNSYLSPRKAPSDVAQDSHNEETYPVTLQQVPSMPVVPQQISVPVSVSQPGAIPIQIILPNDLQHSLPLVTQLLNSSLSTNQNLSNKQTVQIDPVETAQNYLVHIPGNTGSLIKTSGPSIEGQSQSYVLQIPGTGPNCGLNTSELQQTFVPQVPGQVVHMTEVKNSEDQDVS